jgi:hypothetical protein
MPRKHKNINKASQETKDTVTKENPVEKSQNQKNNSATDGNGDKNNGSAGNKKSRRWSRRLLWILTIFIAIIVILRLVLWVSLPWILNRTIKSYNLQCKYERLDFSILTGDAELWHMELKPTDSNDSFVYIEYCKAEVSLITLLSHQFVIPRIEIDGMDVSITRDSNGQFPQLQRFISHSQVKEKEVVTSVTAPADANLPPKEIDLTPPVKLDAMRLQHVQLNFRDESISPVLESRLDMNVRLSDLGSNKRKTRFQITISSPPVLDQFVMEGTGSCKGMDLLAEVKFFINGLHPHLINDYMAGLGISPYADSIALRCNGKIQTRGISGISNSELQKSQEQILTQQNESAPIPRILNIHSDLSDMVMAADGEENLYLKRITIDANMANANSIHISKIEMTEGHAQLWKDVDNAFSADGLKFSSQSWQNAAAPADSNSPAAEKEMVIASQNPVQPFEFVVDNVLLGNLQLIIHDESVSPKTDLAFHLNNLDIARADSQNASSPVQLGIQAELGIPGVINALKLDGTAEPFSSRKKAALKISAEGIRPEAVAVYLEKSGIESLYKNGTFACDVNAVFQSFDDGSMTGEVSIANVNLQDTNQLFGLKAIDVQGISFDPDTKRTRIENVDISGQQLAIERNENGFLDIFGFRLKGAQSQSINEKPSENTLASSSPLSSNKVNNPADSLPLIEIGRFSWHDNKVTFTDKAVSPAESFNITDFGFELENFALDFSRDALSPAKLRAWLKSPDIIEQVELTGSLSARKAGMSLGLELTGRELSAKKINPYLRDFGIEAAIANGGLRAGLTSELDWSEGDLNCSVNIHDAALRDNDANFVALKRMDIEKLQIKDGNIIIEKVAIDQPYLAVGREQTGNLNIAGIRILPVQASDTQTEPASDTKKTTQVTSGTGLKINNFSINNSLLAWTDNFVEPAVSQTLITNVNLNNFTFGAYAQPSKINIIAEIPDVVGKAELAGDFELKTSEQSANLTIDVAGMQTEKLAPYFTSGLKPALENAAIKFHLIAGIGKHKLGGNQINLEISNLDYSNNSTQKPLLKFDTAKAVIDRIDPNSGIAAIKELSVSGLETSGEQKSAGVFSMLGLDFQSGDAASPGTDKIKNETAEVNTPGKTQNAIKVNAGKTSKPLQLSLDTLDLQLNKFTLKNQTKPGSEPIIVSDFKVRNNQPIKLFEDESDPNSIVSIDIAGKVQPLLEFLSLKTESSLFTSKPRFTADLNLKEINISQLTNIMPDLKKAIDSNNLSSSQFSGSADLTLDIGRENISGFDFNKPFGLELFLKNIKYADSNKDVTLAGFDEFNIKIPKLDLAKKSIYVKEVGLVNPRGTISIENDGLHVLGLTLKTSGKDVNDVNNVEAANVTKVASAKSKNNKAEISNKEIQDVNVQKPEIRVDQILVNGIDFVFADKTSKQAMYIPLKGLDFELRGFTTAENAGPIRFNAMLTSGEVSLPKKGKTKPVTDSNNLNAAQLKQISEDLNTEQRVLFQELSASGNLSLYPKPEGWVKVGLSGMELVNFRGTAGKAGMTLNDGVLDTSVDLRFRKEGTLSTKTHIVFTDLSLTEPPDGFLQKLLALPVSLDTVLFILQDSGGAIKLPVSFKIGENGISGGQIASAAIGATAALIANAVANSPFRIAGTITNALGMEEKEQGGLETYVLQYTPGVTTLSKEQLQKIENLIAQLKKDKKLTATIRHELGGGDIEYANSLINPSTSSTIELMSRLKQDKADLYLERDRLASEAKANYAAGISNWTSEKMQLLQETERKIGMTERAIDDLLERMRPGSEHAAGRRTRDASLAIGKARLEEIAEILLNSDISEKQERIRFITPRYTDTQGDSGGNINITLRMSNIP